TRTLFARSTQAVGSPPRSPLMIPLKSVLTCCAVAVAAGALFLPRGAASASGVHGPPQQLETSKLYWGYNSTDVDLGVPLSLDGENWKTMQIDDPDGHAIFKVQGAGATKSVGLSELFCEASEPGLDEVPLDQMLAKYPEGTYDFVGKTTDGAILEGQSSFSHAIPAGPVVTPHVGPGDALSFSWDPVTTNPPGFPVEPIDIVAYEVIVEPFDVIVPGNVFSVTVTPEFVASLPAGEHDWEVLAIDQSHNQTITSGTFTK